jgi:hypothetical protein
VNNVTCDPSDDLWGFLGRFAQLLSYVGGFWASGDAAIVLLWVLLFPQSGVAVQRIWELRMDWRHVAALHRGGEQGWLDGHLAAAF